MPNLLDTCMLVPGVSANNCAGWVQAWGSVLALVVAIGFPIWYGWHTRRNTRRGHFETVALDVRVAEQQARVYLGSKIMVPAYRVPLHGKQAALPALLADGKMGAADATALVQFYVDATSFNYCLDVTQQMKAGGDDWKREVNRIKLKARHLISGGSQSRYDGAIAVLRKHLPAESLKRLDVDLKNDESEPSESA
jgi:hypothetical protein